jgi:hypothetical protein
MFLNTHNGQAFEIAKYTFVRLPPGPRDALLSKEPPL